MKLLVTGGAGFLGSHLCEALLKKGEEVYCLDNLLTGHEKNIAHLKRNKKFHFINHDVTQPLSSNLIVDQIYHLASPASPPKYQQLSIETLMANSLGTYQVLELARKDKAKFLLASTSEVYGNPTQHPQKETYWGDVNPIGLRACYDEGKRFAEAITMEYVRKFNLDARIVRIFNTYGEKMDKDDGRVVTNFINQALSGKPLTIYGSGRQTRSFCYVSDLVAGLVKAMETLNTKGEVFNLGNPKEYTILEIAKIIKEMVGVKDKIAFLPLPQDDPEKRRPDITKARQKLGWEPSVTLEEGLKKTIAYFRK